MLRSGHVDIEGSARIDGLFVQPLSMDTISDAVRGRSGGTICSEVDVLLSFRYSLLHTC
jgi:3-polyprenyl-4-hydroxybenzoate decarboxylase